MFIINGNGCNMNIALGISCNKNVAMTWEREFHSGHPQSSIKFSGILPWLGGF
jgi:hypothetical protein